MKKNGSVERGKRAEHQSLAVFLSLETLVRLYTTGAARARALPEKKRKKTSPLNPLPIATARHCPPPCPLSGAPPPVRRAARPA